MKHLKILSSISAVAAFSLAATGCSSSAEDPNPSPTVTVTQTPEPEVREVVPDSCKEYVTLSERAFEYVGELVSSQSDALILTMDSLESGISLTDSDMTELANIADSINIASTGITSLEHDILSAKNECLGLGTNS